MFLRFVVATTIMVFSFFSHAQDFPNFMSQDQVKSLGDQVDELKEKKTALDKKITRCEDTQGGVAKYCKQDNGRYVLVMNTEYNKIKAQSDELQKKIAPLETQMKKDDEAYIASAKTEKEKAVMTKYTKDIKGILASKKELDADLKSTGLSLKTVYLQLDQSVLGDYTKYVAAEYAKSNEMKQQICKTVASCSDVSKMKNEMNKMSIQVKSFEDYKKEISRSMASQNSSSAKSAPANGTAN